MKNGNHQRVFHKSCNPTIGNRQKGINFFKNCKGIVSDYLPWLLLAVIALVIFMISIFVISGEGNSLLDKIKNLFRFR